MPMPKKTCPKCDTKCAIGVRRCECGHKFIAKGKKKAKAAKVDVVPGPSFACGPSSDGGFVLLWPQKGEQFLLTKDERALLETSLGILRAAAP